MPALVCVGASLCREKRPTDDPSPRYTIPPPATAIDSPVPITLCETMCPLSDGTVYESETGENFIVSFAKRHGLRILWSRAAASFKDCMDLCAKTLVSLTNEKVEGKVEG